MRKDEKKVSFFRRYLKVIVSSFISAFLIGFLVPFWIAISKLKSIKAGEYPGMPKDQIDKQYNEALPSVIQDSILMCFVIMIVVLIPILLIRFKVSHNINLLSEFMQFSRNKKR